MGPFAICLRLDWVHLRFVRHKSEPDSFPVAFGCAFVWMQAEAKLAGGRAYPGVGTQRHTGRARRTRELVSQKCFVVRVVSVTSQSREEHEGTEEC